MSKVKKGGANTPPTPKPPPDPERIFRHALNFDYVGQLLENATPALLSRLAVKEGLPVELLPPPPPVERKTPGGLFLPPVPDHSEPTKSVTVPKDMMSRLPTVFPLGSLRAFTTELFLKCIIAINGVRPPITHELTRLFNLLTPDQQRRMEELYDAHAKSDRAFADLQASEPDKKFTLAFALAEMNKTFETWRYAYEMPYENSLFGHPWKAAGRLILELKPEWRPIAESVNEV